MPARKKITKRVKIELTGAEEKYLFGSTEKRINSFAELDLEYAAHTETILRNKAMWNAHKEPFLKKWIAERPCTRPERWWDFDTTENRLRLAGIGTQAPWSKSSIPDPPCFESQAAFLQRHGLLTTAEKKFLKDHPELLEPEKV